MPARTVLMQRNICSGRGTKVRCESLSVDRRASELAGPGMSMTSSPGRKVHASELGAKPLTSLSQDYGDVLHVTGKRARDTRGGNGGSRPRERVTVIYASSIAVPSKTAASNDLDPTCPMFISGPAPDRSGCATPWRFLSAGRKAGGMRHALDGVAHAEAESSKSGPKSNPSPCLERSYKVVRPQLVSALLAPKTDTASK